MTWPLATYLVRIGAASRGSLVAGRFQRESKESLFGTARPGRREGIQGRGVLPPIYWVCAGTTANSVLSGEVGVGCNQQRALSLPGQRPRLGTVPL